ncbi:PadR family transcriptional regulator [Alkalicella caledoniensis]|uniref:PadR family transcriptional regulator n=1 Tax=Alkalicella caledoniensis TaxID=2731377 RepID=A0A7G9WAS6_ALKCA|nr:PadR family transcriptional regulator [Alkalicella caledoniensis]QNO15788.1 PadR family transcriptional regulator [Alkalicella caledoniensis]
MNDKMLKKYLPLSEATFYTLLSLTKPMHGYAIMQFVENLSGGAVKLGAGTLYGILGKLEKEEIIEIYAEVDRKKSYILTENGRYLLEKELARLNRLVSNANSVLAKGVGF